MTKRKKGRVAGFYWVKDGRGWTIGLWVPPCNELEEVGHFFLAGFEQAYAAEEFKIDERKLERG